MPKRIVISLQLKWFRLFFYLALWDLTYEVKKIKNQSGVFEKVQVVWLGMRSVGFLPLEIKGKNYSILKQLKLTLLRMLIKMTTSLLTLSIQDRKEDGEVYCSFRMQTHSTSYRKNYWFGNSITIKRKVRDARRQMKPRPIFLKNQRSSSF